MATFAPNPPRANQLPANHPGANPRRAGLARRLLGSPVLALLLGPHGVDRYLELINPRLTIAEGRGEIVAVDRPTPRSVTLTVRANAAWDGFAAGQYAAIGTEIDGVRRTRTYSPAGSQHAGRDLELTATEHPGGLVSGHLLRSVRPGAIVHLAPAQGGRLDLLQQDVLVLAVGHLASGWR
jgi:stearoyl-CoA 9-desaturase NADPH oxidoreductase